MSTSTEERNAELMQTLDDAWNAQDVKIRARHKPDVIVRWPGQPKPTVGIEDHTTQSIARCETSDQQLDNRPYKVFLASGNNCWIARFRGTMSGPMTTTRTGRRSTRRVRPSRSTSTRSPSGTRVRSWRRTSCTTSSAS